MLLGCGAAAEHTWYLCQGNYAASTAVFRDGCDTSELSYSDASYWFTFFILFNNLLPLSLYVTLEVVNFVQAFYVDQVGCLAARRGAWNEP